MHNKPVTKRGLARDLGNADSKASDTTYGMSFATVTNENDPKNLGRIKVRLDYMAETEETPWISPMGGFQGNGFGSTFDIPMKGDRVRIQNILGNVHNMVYSPGFYSEAEQADLVSTTAVIAPTDADGGNHKATKKERKNILKTMSGWLLEIIEGQQIQEKWKLSFQSPTSRDLFRWFAPKHEKTGRPGSVLFIKIDDLMEFWDETSPDGEKAVFRWEYLLKLIELQMHKKGRIVIRDHKGSSLSWDDDKQMVEFKLPEKKLFLKDRLGGNFTYNSQTSSISMKLIDNIEAVCKNMKIGAIESFEIRVGSIVTPDPIDFKSKPGNGGKYIDVKDPIIPPEPSTVNGTNMLLITPGRIDTGGVGGQPVGRVGDTVEVLVPGIGLCYGVITSGSAIHFSK